MSESESESDMEVDEVEDDGELTSQGTRRLVASQNVKDNKKKKRSGGFQAMGLSHGVIKGVLRKGYRVPTPIQRKCIPEIMHGHDVVAMARTGSGKTAAFLIPAFEKLQTHSAKVGARALILSPTRELAMQTLKFTKELGRFTSLRSTVVLGGDSLEDQFAAMHENPDVIIATPGRFLHLIIEMNLKLHSIEYVVFDEADRLFEMGFDEQLREIIRQLPENRQTLLFSATLPKLLVEFARAGLRDPHLIRLDVDSKLSDQLKMAFLFVRSEDKPGALLYLLRNVVKDNEQTVVFTATKHHVEYIQQLLSAARISCSSVYSSLDPTARKINIAKFTNKKTNVLVVTDVAARGIDIPKLDNVINFNFPCTSKLFVHRVGRVARAGASGTAYSLLSADEVPYLLDLHLFLGRPLECAGVTRTKGESSNETASGVLGTLPSSLTEEDNDLVLALHRHSDDLTSAQQVAANGFKQYVRSRPQPSVESVKRYKEMDFLALKAHPWFAERLGSDEQQRVSFLAGVKKFKPSQTIFEVNVSTKNSSSAVMRSKRSFHDKVISTAMRKATEKQQLDQTLSSVKETCTSCAESTAEDLKGVFTSVFDPSVSRKRKRGAGRSSYRDENYVAYTSSDSHTEKGLSLNRTDGHGGVSFEQSAANATMDFVMDDAEEISNAKKMRKRWDRKRKKFVGDVEGPKKIRTESGATVPVSFKSNMYSRWTAKHHVDQHIVGVQEKSTGLPTTSKFMGKKGRRFYHQKGLENDQPSSSLGPQGKCKGSKGKRGGGQGTPTRGHGVSAGLHSREVMLKKRLKNEQVKVRQRRGAVRHGTGGGRSKGKGHW